MQSSRITILSVIAIILLILLGVWWYFGFSIGFMRFFAAELTPTPTSSATPSASAMVTCSPASQTIAVGQPATLAATGGAGQYSWYAPQGSPVSQETGSAAFSVTYSTAGIKKVTVQGARLVGGSSSNIIDSVACTVIVQ